MNKKLIFVFLLFPLLSMAQNKLLWSTEKANEWYSKQGWLRGSNFIPSTAINQLEMWQEASFDPATIGKELGWAESIGFNCMRVFLHHAAWQADPSGFKNRMDQYLTISNSKHIKTIFVFFDDCWNPTYQLGKQPDPKIGVHNSGWVRDPGELLYTENNLNDTLELYVKDILKTFKKDNRIAFWDLYNEAGNSGYGNKSLPLLKSVFTWASEVRPSQPISSGLWNASLKEINTFLLSNSDIISYHDYQEQSKHEATIDTLENYKRPLVCTEYMARTKNSTFATILPILKEKNIGAINWGLVSGKTNTIYAWDTPIPDGNEPSVWFHDIFRKDGSPFDPKEISFIKEMTNKK